VTRWFRYVALAEAISFVALLVATAVKYGLDEPGGVELLGPIHGLLFLAYFVMVVFVREERRWNLRQTLAVLAAAVIPLGGFFVEMRLLRHPIG
jgi:integral membrane protein